MKYVKVIVPILVPILILMMTPPEGMPIKAWQLFAVYMGAILGIMFRPVPESVALIVAIAASSIIFKNTGVVLAGFASTSVWLVFSAFMVGQAFVETGLGKRIAYILIGKLGRTPIGIGFVAAFTDMSISPATPSNTARTGGLVYPIFRSIAVTLGSNPGPTARKLGAYLSLLLYQISITTASMFLTASATNLLVTGFAAKILNYEVSWIQWSIAMTPLTFIVLMALPYLVYKMYPPELKTIDNKAIAKKGLEECGPLTTREKTLAVLFVLALLGWATGTITKIDGTAVAVAFVAACIVTKVVSWDNLLNAKGAWNTFIWFGGIVGLADGLGKAGFFVWLTKVMSATVNLAGYNTYVILGVLLFLSIIVRYFFASLSPYCVTFLPVLFTLGLIAGVPPGPLVFLLGASSEFACALTHYGNAVAPVLYAPGYVDQPTWWGIGTVLVILNSIFYMTVGLAYWKIIGIW